MRSGRSIETTLLPGAAELLAAHARELPQRDDLCGAFCGALALSAAGIHPAPGEILDQDAVGIAAGSLVAEAREPGALPGGELGRRDYRLALPQIADSAVSGTTADGVVHAIAELSAGRLQAIPYRGPWSATTLGGLFDLATEGEGAVTLIANLATRHLWGARTEPALLLAHLLDGSGEGAAADWDVGHFACLPGRIRGPGGELYIVADTYPALGWRGIHLQPPERLAAAIERRDMPAGGVLAVVGEADAKRLRAGALRLGMVEGMWDNGTPAIEALA